MLSASYLLIFILTQINLIEAHLHWSVSRQSFLEVLLALGQFFFVFETNCMTRNLRTLHELLLLS